MSEAERYYQDGLRLAAQGNLGGAFAALERAVELDPEHVAACKELARLSLQANEKRAFTNWCHEAMRVDENDPEPHLMMAEVLVAGRRWEEAADELRVARSLRPMQTEQAERAHTLQTLIAARHRNH